MVLPDGRKSDRTLLVIKLDKVSFGYDGRQTLSELTAELGPGSFHFLTGSSGAGKTPLMKDRKGVG